MDSEAFKLDRLHELTHDRQHGAAELTRSALQCLADYCMLYMSNDPKKLVDELVTFSAQLQQTRPSMAPLENLLTTWTTKVQTTKEDDIENLRLKAVDHAHTLIKKSQHAVQKIAEHVATIIEPGSTIITHSLSSTIVESFRILKDKEVKAIITESRPGYEGRHLAEILAEFNIATKYITDAQLGYFTSKADLALVGADTILSDGSVVNKAGTYLLALAAHKSNIPLFVCAETFKQSTKNASNIQLEIMNAEELQAPNYANIDPINLYFDITPKELITNWITENGIAPLNNSEQPTLN